MSEIPKIPEVLQFNPYDPSHSAEDLVNMIVAAQEHLDCLSNEADSIVKSTQAVDKSTNLIDELVYTYAVAYINSEEFSKQIEETVAIYVGNYLERLNYSQFIDRDYIGDSVTSVVEEVIEDITLDIRIR